MSDANDPATETSDQKAPFYTGDMAAGRVGVRYCSTTIRTADDDN